MVMEYVYLVDFLLLLVVYSRGYGYMGDGFMLDLIMFIGYVSEYVEYEEVLYSVYLKKVKLDLMLDFLMFIML